MTEKKAPEPMDATAPERESGEPPVNQRRKCYAAVTLLQETLALFPETKYDVREYNGREVGLAILFTGPPEMIELLKLSDADQRVAYAQPTPDYVEEGGIEIGFHNQPRTYDLRDTFGLDEAWLVLAEDLELAEAGIEAVAEVVRQCKHRKSGIDPVTGECGNCGEIMDYLHGGPALDGAAHDWTPPEDQTEGGDAADTTPDVQDGGGA